MCLCRFLLWTAEIKNQNEALWTPPPLIIYEYKSSLASAVSDKDHFEVVKLVLCALGLQLDNHVSSCRDVGGEEQPDCQDNKTPLTALSQVKKVRCVFKIQMKSSVMRGLYSNVFHFFTAWIVCTHTKYRLDLMVSDVKGKMKEAIKKHKSYVTFVFHFYFCIPLPNGHYRGKVLTLFIYIFLF